MSDVLEMDLSELRVTIPGEEIEEHIEEFPFHPCHTPRGLSWYNFSVLTAFQQKQLNELKVDTVRDDNKYLADHPEVRAIIALFIREVFKTKPVTKPIHVIAKKYFDRPLDDIKAEIDQYLRNRGEPLNKQGNSATRIHGGSSAASLEDIPSLYYPHYFSYLSYTEGQSMTEFIPEESSLEYQDFETDMESMLTYSPNESQEDSNPDHLVVTRVGTETDISEGNATGSQSSEINIGYLDYLRGNYGE